MGYDVYECMWQLAAQVFACVSNALGIRTASQSDAVASSVADRMRIPKADILNAENGTTNPAVKLALAETHVIQETKRYLEEVYSVIPELSIRNLN